MVVRVGGSRLGASRDAAPRAVVCLTDAKRNIAVATALGEAGFQAETSVALVGSCACPVDGSPVIVVIDSRARGWLRTITDLIHRCPAVRPVVLTDVDKPDEFLAALTSGVSGFCRFDASVEEIVRTVQYVDQSGVAIPRDMVGSLVAQVRHGRGYRMNTIAGPIDVTDREWEIMQLMLQRRSTREIADALYVSVGTVRSHVCALVRKAGALDRDDLVAMVERYAGR